MPLELAVTECAGEVEQNSAKTGLSKVGLHNFGLLSHGFFFNSPGSGSSGPTYYNRNAVESLRVHQPGFSIQHAARNQGVDEVRTAVFSSSSKAAAEEEEEEEEDGNSA